jgi:anti-sigma-K factor RskA
LADRADAPNEPLANAVEIAQADRDSLSTTLVAEGSEASADAIIDQDGHGYVLARDLPTLPEGQTYQLWGVVESGDVISLGIFGPNPEIETFTVEGTVNALAITIEQYPGVVSNGNPDGAFVGTF